ncbi:hypothetical protein H9P43_005721 [Blastocladiella emersonii ATCC 22665]|nr:hypothetical protein H9P43_005721 [Blastocladiella emersonii ATCC 22665]
MECLRVLQDLEAAGTKLRTPFLDHLFRDFSPSQSAAVHQALHAFHTRDRTGEVFDFRAAYHQFADWLFGWNVSEIAASAAATPATADDAPRRFTAASRGLGDGALDDSNPLISDGVGPDSTYSVRRVPRNIDLREATERTECARLLETFQTQYAMGMRHLRRSSILMEERLPLIGRNIAQLTFADDMAGEHEDERAVWGTGPSDGEAPSSGPMATSAANPTRLVKPLAAGGMASAAPPPAFASGVDMDPIDSNIDAILNSVKETLEDRPLMTPGTDGLGSSLIEPVQPRRGVSRRNSLVHGNGPAPPSRRGSIHGKDGADGAPHPPMSRRNSVANGGKAPLPNINSSTASPTNRRGGAASRVPTPGSRPETQGSQGSQHSSAPSSSGSKPTTAPDAPAEAAVDRVISPPGSAGSTRLVAPVQLTEAEILRQDLDAVFLDVSMTLDLHIACAVSCVVVLAFAELVNDRALYSKFLAATHALGVQLVSTPLRVVWDLTRRAAAAAGNVPAPLAAQLCDLSAFKAVMTAILKTRAYKPGDRHFLAMSRLHAKLAVLHHLLVGVDMFLFPPLVAAHVGTLLGASGVVLGVGMSGVKALRPTAFDGNIWVTGGYDCKVRIWDLAEATCLAQFTGHKSIVTDVHFVKADAYIVSASFDKTIKVWNAQTAACERTLLGHADSVTTCDVSPDGRYILSGSLDATLRLWEFASGDCLATVKKHTRYVKAVKFSPDGRYAASAGLDRRVYIWDVKILAYSKSITHVRCIEAHDDYVLALDLARPSLLVTVARDMTVKLWDYMTGHCMYAVTLSPAWACTVAFGADAELFAVGCFDNSVHVFRTKSGERVRVLKVLNAGVLAVRFPKRGYDAVMCGTSEGFVQKLVL